MAKKKQTKKWLPSPPSRAASPTMHAVARVQVEAKVQELVDRDLKPRYVKPPPKDAPFNYVTDITLKWHGSTLFLVAVYACPGPNAISPTFEARFARVRPDGSGRFDLSFQRYTGKWVELYQGQTLEECLESIRDDPWFQM